MSILLGVSAYYYTGSFGVSIPVSIGSFTLLNYFDHSKRYFRLGSTIVFFVLASLSYNFFFKLENQNSTFIIFTENLELEHFLFLGILSSLLFILDFSEQKTKDKLNKFFNINVKKNRFNNKGNVYYSENDMNVTIKKEHDRKK